MISRPKLAVLGALAALGCGISLAQNWGWQRSWDNVGPIVRTEGRDGEAGVEVDERTVRTAR